MANDPNGQIPDVQGGQWPDAAVLEMLKQYLFGNLRGKQFPGGSRSFNERRPSGPPMNRSMRPGGYGPNVEVPLEAMPGPRPDVSVPPGQRPDPQSGGWSGANNAPASWGTNEGIPMPRDASGSQPGDGAARPDVQSGPGWSGSWGAGEGLPMPRDGSGASNGSPLPDVQSGNQWGSLDDYIRANQERNTGRFNRRA